LIPYFTATLRKHAAPWRQYLWKAGEEKKSNTSLRLQGTQLSDIIFVMYGMIMIEGYTYIFADKKRSFSMMGRSWDTKIREVE